MKVFFANPASLDLSTIAEFVQKLEDFFLDPAKQEKADTKLLRLRQRNRPFYEFINN
jgi:hypothetical protein